MIYCISIEGITKEEIELSELTNNTIILCQNSELKYKLITELNKIITGEADREESNVSYSTNDDEDVGMKLVSTYKPTTIYDINNGEQRIIVTVEAPTILSMENINDLWFLGKLSSNDNEVSMYALTEFSGHKEFWEQQGAEGIYLNTIRGRYGTYEAYGE